MLRRKLHPDCTTGILDVLGGTEHGTSIATFVTIEQPWDDNIPYHSCVPSGLYTLEPHSSSRHPIAYALANADLRIFHTLPHDAVYGDRADCLIHAANWAYQLEGCIAPGSHLIDSEKGLMVTDSDASVKKLFEILGINVTGHTLEIMQE